AAYIDTYGSWAEGERREPFPRFVIHRNRPLPGPLDASGRVPLRADSMFQRHARAPFRFLLLDAEGQVIKPGGDYRLGQFYGEDYLDDSYAVELHGRVVARAVPLGEPNLSPQDLSYLAAMRRALLIGFVVAGSLAALLGLLF